MRMAAVKPWVEYNWLGPNCGIKVANICLGAGTFGATKSTLGLMMPGNTDEVGSHAILDRYIELGGNFVDTANTYTGGESEEIIGSWLGKRDRGSIVLATKVRLGSVDNDALPNDCGLSRGSILQNLERSLKRLKTDYIDVYYMHAWDSGVKLEETLRTFNDVVRSGKVRYVGCSNVTGRQLQKIVDYNKFMGFDQFVALEQEYNLASHFSDIEVVPACREEGISMIPWSPLKGGLLTGKFKRDDKDVDKSLAGTRLGWTAEKPQERTNFALPNVEEYRNNDDYWKLMDVMDTVAKHHGKSPAQVAIRWLLQKDFIPSVVIGAKSVAQLDDNMGAGTGWTLTDQEMKQLDDASAFGCQIPTYPYKMIDQFNTNRRR